MRSHVRFILLVPLAVASAGGGVSRVDAQCTVPASCGQWEGPFDLDASCPTTSSCGRDEIVHAALIPTGVRKGHVILWTLCQALRGTCDDDVNDPNPYTSHILNPHGAEPEIVEHPPFHAAYGLDIGDDLVDGPFCSGHTWILDQDENPKLLVAGGLRGTSDGSRETLWFDPISVAWLDGPGLLPPLDMQSGAAWYPSVLTFFDPALDPPRFRPIAVGGTTQPGASCASDTYMGWWTMELPPAGSSAAPQWTAVTNPDGFKWPNYPRARLMHTSSGQGEIVTAGQDRVCVGSDPCQKIHTADAPQTHEEFVQADGVDRWHENNAVVQHTLRPNWTWNTETPLLEYQLNRLFGLMGAPTGMPDAPALVETRELIHGSILENGPNTPMWTEKADAPVGRVFANAVLLPDGSIVVVGGQNEHESGGDDNTVYWFTADRFDPANPADAGSWTTLAESNIVGFQRTPRGYHSVAMLLSDGSVLAMGGENHSDITAGFPSSDDTAEIYKPPYFFNGSRPVLGNPGATIRYGETFLVNLTVPVGRQVERFCLVGVSSVTHSNDSGQRYVELMWRNPPPSGGQANNQREVLAPPEADMAPEGYYMLFGVDNAGVPSLGRFVKLTF